LKRNASQRLQFTGGFKTHAEKCAPALELCQMPAKLSRFIWQRYLSANLARLQPVFRSKIEFHQNLSDAQFGGHLFTIRHTLYKNCSLLDTVAEIESHSK
jgi:hypothetical protein